MNELEFIADTELRSRIKDAIEYIYALYERVKKEETNAMFQEETYRVIILYIVSILEAILLYVYKNNKDHVIREEYRYIQALPGEYKHSAKQDCPVVIAVRVPIPKEDRLGMDELVDFFVEKKILKLETANRMSELNNLRNTFHFSKKRDGSKCDVDQVERALELLVYTIEHVPYALKR